LSHHADEYMGNHDFKFGVQIERSLTDLQYGYSGGMLYHDYNYSGYLYQYRYVSPPPEFPIQDKLEIVGPDVHVNRLTSYAQDEWNINDRLTLSLGIHWDHNRGITDRGTVFKTDPVAPRLGFIWKPASQTVFKAHYGDYYDALFQGLFLFVTDSVRDTVVQRFNGQDWVEVFRYGFRANADSKLKHAFVREFTAGVDQEFRGGIALGAHYIHRRWKNILEDINVHDEYVPVPFVNPLTGELITVFNNQGHDTTAPSLLTNPDGLFRKYDALEISASRRFTNNLSLSGSVVYCRTTGNVPNVGLGVFGVFTPFLNDPNNLINFEGRLVNDPSFAWKIVGTYDLPFGFKTGWFFRHQSGDTWATTISLPRRLVSQGGRILGEPLGSNRLPSQNILDLRIEKQFGFNHGQISATADIFNVFNTATVIAVDDHFENPTFGTATAYTDPRTIRLGLRYSF
jgi:TonB-dependent receptor-like protein